MDVQPYKKHRVEMRVSKSIPFTQKLLCIT
jgi:hypothetical protein